MYQNVDIATQYAPVRIAPTKRGLIAKFPRGIPSSRVTLLNLRYARIIRTALLSAARSRDSRTQRRDREGWLTPFSESAVRAVVTSQPARARAGNGGTERGAPPRAANLKAYHGERQRERAESRAERRRRRSTLERKGCVVGGNLKERWARERKREGYEGGESGRVGEFGSSSRWCSTWHR